jgi:RNA polymerase sigma-70 factor, ECF subfamily
MHRSIPNARAAHAVGREPVATDGLPARLPEAVFRLAADATIADAELAQRCLGGQQDAFAALVARYQKRAFWIATHVVGSTEDAQDVVQEAFARLHRSLHRYDPARSFYTWFYRIVMNLAIDQLRKTRSARASRLDDLLGMMADEREAGASLPLERREEDQLVWAILDRLDVKFRSVLVLRDIHGLSCREIAPMLRVTHATARWRLHRGRQAFRALWERCQQRGES